MHSVRDVDPIGGDAVLIQTDLLAVKEDVSSLAHAFELEEDAVAGKRGRELEVLAIPGESFVPMSPPPWEMSLRKESTSLKLWGVATAVHLESSKSGTSALGTSSRMNLQSRLKFSVVRGDLGELYGPLADWAAANAG
jgi:hypothetical protein